MTDPLNITDLINGKEDLDTIGKVAMVGTLADTTINRQGVQVDTIEGRLKKLGFEPPLAYAAGITFSGPLDAVKTVDNAGIIYGCLASARPFTTTGNFANDVASFFVVQDGNQAVGDVRTDASNTYEAGTAQSFDTATANTFNLDGQDLGDELASINQSIDDNALAIAATKNPTRNAVLLTTIGAGTWTKPAGVTTYKVTAIGPGGGGGGSAASNNTDIPGYLAVATGGEGGQGGIAVGFFTGTDAEESIPFSIGDGGLGGKGNTDTNPDNPLINGLNGGITWFKSSSELRAIGGNGGQGGRLDNGLSAGFGGEGRTTSGSAKNEALSIYGKSGRSGSIGAIPISTGATLLSLPFNGSPGDSSQEIYGLGGLSGFATINTNPPGALSGKNGQKGFQGAIIIEWLS